jgi:hypothetical protein
MHENFKNHLKKADLGVLIYLKSFWDKEASNTVAKNPLFFTAKEKQMLFPNYCKNRDLKLPWETTVMGLPHCTLHES